MRPKMILRVTLPTDEGPKEFLLRELSPSEADKAEKGEFYKVDGLCEVSVKVPK